MTRPVVDSCSSVGKIRLHQNFAGHFVQRIQPVGSGFIGTEYPEVFRIQVQLHHVTQKSAEHPGGFRKLRTRLRNLHGVVAKIRHEQILEQQAAIGVRVCAHPPVACGREFGQFGCGICRSRRKAPREHNSSSSLPES